MMPSDAEEDITTLLTRMNVDTSAKDQLYRLVEGELRAIAEKQMLGERADHTLQPTILVDDAFMRLVDKNADVDWQNRCHFYRAAARAMRQLLIDHARAKKAKKRPQQRLPLDRHALATSMSAVELLALDEALTRLADVDPRQAEVVQLHVFSGNTLAETAKILGVSRSTVKGDWAAAKAWLHRELTRGDNRE